jgi:AraC-like DNA-binding protein
VAQRTAAHNAAPGRDPGIGTKGPQRMQVARQRLFAGELLEAWHASARPSREPHAEFDRQETNVLVLPLQGAFVLHDGPRRRAVATPHHAVFVAARRPYRMSLPGEAGDRCLTLRFAADTLARVAPEAMRGDGFDLSAFESCAPIAPATELARHALWRVLQEPRPDPLQAEELGIEVLTAALGAARRDGRPWNDAGPAARHRLRRIGRVVEAVSAQPERRWTLGELAELAHVSPSHLSHAFRAETGAPVHRHVLRCRLSKALDLLLASDAEITAIAHAAGFASHSHFTARFCERFGLTPGALRRQRARGAQVRSFVTAAARDAG